MDSTPLIPTDADMDFDNDGLTNKQEVELGTDINNPDTDGDGILDGIEVEHGQNPLDPADADMDSDNDGLTNKREVELGTNPNTPDSDNDGVIDGEEVLLEKDPLNPSDGIYPNGKEIERQDTLDDNEASNFNKTIFASYKNPICGSLLIVFYIVLLTCFVIRKRRLAKQNQPESKIKMDVQRNRAR
jgi:hypothetical protein